MKCRCRVCVCVARGCDVLATNFTLNPFFPQNWLNANFCALLSCICDCRTFIPYFHPSIFLQSVLYSLFNIKCNLFYTIELPFYWNLFENLPYVFLCLLFLPHSWSNLEWELPEKCSKQDFQKLSVPLNLILLHSFHLFSQFLLSGSLCCVYASLCCPPTRLHTVKYTHIQGVCVTIYI